ncbi:MAG: fibronectin type III domain-containing protein [Bacteroidales bacterium]|nr:fibronectin type III domain-containing protein [Bacteroidales bacterium]
MGRKTTIFGISVLLIFLIGFYSNALGATLSWDANAEIDKVTGYNLYYSTNPGSLTPKVDVDNATKMDVGNVTFYRTDLLTLADDTTYYFVVTACNTAGESDPSNMVSWTTPAPPDTTPPEPPTEEFKAEEVPK